MMWFHFLLGERSAFLPPGFDLPRQTILPRRSQHILLECFGKHRVYMHHRKSPFNAAIVVSSDEPEDQLQHSSLFQCSKEMIHFPYVKCQYKT
jgi:hypothetical protein